jgi:hypothetical protein
MEEALLRVTRLRSGSCKLTAVGETSFNIDFLANTKNRVGNRVAHEPLLLNRELYRNHNS